MKLAVDRMLFFFAGAGATAGMLAFVISSDRHRHQQAAEQSEKQLAQLQQTLEISQARESASRESVRQMASSNSALKAAMRESAEETARLAQVLSQRKLLPLAVARIRNAGSRFEFQLMNLGTESLDLYISVENPERKRTDADYPKSRSSFQKIPPKRALIFPGYAGDTLTVASRGHVDFKDTYP